MNVKHRSFFSLAVLVILSSCGTASKPDDQLILSDAEVRVVTAHDAFAGRGPLGISDRFQLDGKMVAFVNINWPETHHVWGKQSFESRWYIGDKLVVKRETEFSISKSPFRFWSNMLPITLGPGVGRYEIYADGHKIGTKSFEIVAPAHLPEPPTVPARPAVLRQVSA